MPKQIFILLWIYVSKWKVKPALYIIMPLHRGQSLGWTILCFVWGGVHGNYVKSRRKLFSNTKKNVRGRYTALHEWYSHFMTEKCHLSVSCTRKGGGGDVHALFPPPTLNRLMNHHLHLYAVIITSINEFAIQIYKRISCKYAMKWDCQLFWGATM